MTIGAKIAACRKRAGMSQEKLANELDISRQAVSRWETGEAVPDTEKVIQLSRIFHVTTDYLLLDIDEAPQSAAPAENNREAEQCRPHPLRHPHPHPRIHLYRQRVIVRAK